MTDRAPPGRWAWPAAAAALVLPAAWPLVSGSPAMAFSHQGPWVFHPNLGWSLEGLGQSVTTAWVHVHALHALWNLLAGGLLGWVGWRAGLSWPWALAWILAWPLTHLLLGVWPEPLAWVVGASGVLHAGWTVLLIGAWRTSASRHVHRRCVWLAVGLLIKLLHEAAWRHPLMHVPSLNMDVAVGAHLTGVVAGAAVAILTAWGYYPARMGGAVRS